MREEWKYLQQGDAPPNVPIEDRIWKNLPRRTVEKTIEVNLFLECLKFGVILCLCLFIFFFVIPFSKQMCQVDVTLNLRDFVTDIMEAAVSGVLSLSWLFIVIGASTEWMSWINPNYLQRTFKYIYIYIYIYMHTYILPS